MSTTAPRRSSPGPERTRRSGNRPLSAFEVLVAGVVCFVLASLLNAQHLHRMAEDLPVTSDVRKPAMTVTGWLKSLSGAFQLTRPGQAIDDRRPGGAGFAEATADATTPAAADGTPATSAAASADPNAPTTAPTGSSAPAANAPATTVAGDSTVPTLPAGPKVPTKADKALLYIAGDSLGKDLAVPLQAMAEDTGVVRTAVRAEVGTGLVRPDRYNWPAQLKSDMDALHPDIVVVEFGGNDTQGIPMPGGQDIQSVLDPKWTVEYSRRVGAVMDLLNAPPTRKLIWVGVPNNRDDAKTAELAVIRQITQNEANKRGITYVDTWALFESPEGNYADYIVVDGDLKQVRKTDGFHLNTDGVNYLARNVLDPIVAELKARGAQI